MRINDRIIVPLTLTSPVPWPMRPSDVHRMSQREMKRPSFWTTCDVIHVLVS